MGKELKIAKFFGDLGKLSKFAKEKFVRFWTVVQNLTRINKF